MIADRVVCFVFFLLFLAMVPCSVEGGGPPPYKVLVVMSYHETYSWGKEIREGINSTLGGVTVVRYEYLDTKNNMSGGVEKARKVYEVYREYKPDGVIAADDAAQSLFVVPYLKDKVKTPIMFCGVNEDPEVYGYPASNVSGILERSHMKESLAFLQQLVPSVQTFCCLMKDGPSSWGILRQIQGEAGAYPVRFVTSVFSRDLPDAVKKAKQLNRKCDALFLTPMDGLVAEDGRHLTSREASPVLIKAFGKPTFSDIESNAESGVLSAVIKAGQEQGATAAAMLLKAMRGRPVATIPITRNTYGKRVINVTTLKRMGIKARPVILRGAQLVKTDE